MSIDQYDKVIAGIEMLRTDHRREVNQLNDQLAEELSAWKHAFVFGQVAMNLLAKATGVTSAEAEDAIYQAWRAIEVPA